jgi:hypothetical protein
VAAAHGPRSRPCPHPVTPAPIIPVPLIPAPLTPDPATLAPLTPARPFRRPPPAPGRPAVRLRRAACRSRPGRVRGLAAHRPRSALLTPHGKYGEPAQIGTMSIETERRPRPLRRAPVAGVYTRLSSLIRVTFLSNLPGPIRVLFMSRLQPGICRFPGLSRRHAGRRHGHRGRPEAPADTGPGLQHTWHSARLGR